MFQDVTTYKTMAKRCSNPNCGFIGEGNYCQRCGKEMLEIASATQTVAEGDDVGDQSLGAEASFQTNVDTGERTLKPERPSDNTGKTQTQVCVNKDFQTL